jgi:predicted dehydrogenase
MRSGRQIVALVGGGRWGRVHASNLSRLLTSRDRVLWVSHFNQDILHGIIAQFAKDGPQFDLRTSLEDGLREQPTSALVITAPASHFSVAEFCLRRGIHTFVEKPLSFRTSEALSLIKIASRNNLVLAVGLHLLSASYLRHFRSQFTNRAISNIAIRWFDRDQEYRYGEIKRADHSTPIVYDIYPHIWSIVRLMTDYTEQRVTGVSVPKAGVVSFQSQAGGVMIEAECRRSAQTRERIIQVKFSDGGLASLDFAHEPGISTLDGIPLPADPLWGSSPTPLMAEVKEFFNQISLPSRNPKWAPLAGNCLDSVVGAETLFDRLN